MNDVADITRDTILTRLLKSRISDHTVSIG